MSHDLMQHLSEEVDFALCYACGKCSSGCPVAERMDFKPHQVVRLLQMGSADELVDARSPWECVGCQTCLARCPNRIDLPRAFARIRHEAMTQGRLENAGTAPIFENLFLRSLRRRGRVNDGMVVALYKLRAGGLLRDWRLGLKMKLAGKLKLFVPGVKDRESVKRLFTDPGQTDKDE